MRGALKAGEMGITLLLSGEMISVIIMSFSRVGVTNSRRMRKRSRSGRSRNSSVERPLKVIGVGICVTMCVWVTVIVREDSLGASNEDNSE